MVTPADGTVTVAEAVLFVSLIEVATKVTVRLLAGGLFGAVYVADSPLAVVVGETLPHAVAEHVTAQVTPWFPGSFATVAVNCAPTATCTVAALGAMDRVIARSVTFAETDLDGSATEVAVIVTVRSLAGAVLGAEYVVAIPLAVVVGETPPQEAAGQVTVQVTPSFVGSFPTVAVNGSVVPAGTVSLVGKTETVIGIRFPGPPPQPKLAPSRATVSRIPKSVRRWLGFIGDLSSAIYLLAAIHSR